MIQMKIEKAIKKLMEEYEKARNAEFVRDPVAYALYQVWKLADADDKPKPNPLCQFWDTGHGMQWCNQLVKKVECRCNGRPEKCDYQGRFSIKMK